MDAPDPLDTVTVLRSDFDMLQAAANAAMEDYVNLLELLRLRPPEGAVPRQFMHDVVLPMIARLVVTQGYVDEANEEILAAAKRFENTTKTFGNGTMGLKVGQRIPGLFGPGT